ncbi:hypothetical protein SLE2022_347270 [Rubroshorea leprosula]
MVYWLLLGRNRIPNCVLDQLRWDMGLACDYYDSLIPHHLNLFSLVCLPNDLVGLKLLAWDDVLVVVLWLKRKCMKTLEEWKGLLYTSPFADAPLLDQHIGVSKKRIMEKFACMMRKVFLDKSKGLSKIIASVGPREVFGYKLSGNDLHKEGESNCDLISEYELD